jgi:hypothetical protein
MTRKWLSLGTGLHDAEGGLHDVERALRGVERPLHAVERALRGEERALQREERALQREERALQGEERALQGEERALQGVERPLQGVERPLQGVKRALHDVEGGLQPVRREVWRAACVSMPVRRSLAAAVLVLMCGCSNSVDLSGADQNLHPWQPGTPIGFDDLATGTDVTQQYPHATFSSDPGCSCQASDAAGIAASPPNYLFTYYTCPTGPTASVYVDFDVPVGKLSFKGVGVNDATKVATLHVVTVGGTYSVDMVGQGDPSTPVLVDLSRFQHVVRLEIVDVDDPWGMGFDDFAFDVDGVTSDATKR